MKNYTLAALISSASGWGIATVFYSIGYFLLNRIQAWEAIKIIAPLTFLISLLANIFFLQIPRYFIKKLFFKYSRLAFGLGYSVLAYLTLRLTFGNAFGYNPVEQLATFNPIINGFVLGFTFHSVWKPIHPTPEGQFSR
ncbi:MAG: hypothetical protein ACRYFX_16730 [Janthinobacterium lividum]